LVQRELHQPLLELQQMLKRLLKHLRLQMRSSMLTHSLLELHLA